jgi:hypoxanthine phosphoribosyltransferase
MIDEDLETVMDEDAIEAAVAGLAERISRDYAGRDPVLVGVLKAAVPFLADLARALTIPAEIDFLEASSYGSGIASSGAVRITKDLDRDITARHLLIVDCIADSGRTLKTVMERLRERHPASVEAAVLIDKRVRRVVDVPIRYTGIEVPDRFLVGYGLDKAQHYRNLPYIAAVRGS